jgi:hypothetical protein
MRIIFNSIYLIIFLTFIRKTLNKITEDFSSEFPIFNVDASSCWNLMVDDDVVAYSFSKMKVSRMAHALVEECPELKHRIKLVQDEDGEIRTEKLSLKQRVALEQVIERFEGED